MDYILLKRNCTDGQYNFNFYKLKFINLRFKNLEAKNYFNKITELKLFSNKYQVYFDVFSL